MHSTLSLFHMEKNSCLLNNAYEFSLELHLFIILKYSVSSKLILLIFQKKNLKSMNPSFLVKLLYLFPYDILSTSTFLVQNF